MLRGVQVRRVMQLCIRFFFFNDTATTEIYTLSLHDALPISVARARRRRRLGGAHGVRRLPGHARGRRGGLGRAHADRKSTRLNSSHANISYAVFCLKKKKIIRPSLCLITSKPDALPPTVHDL